jgi:hypothetical protein
MDKCPFDDEDFILDINTPCPTCGMLGSFIYDNPMDDTCVANPPQPRDDVSTPRDAK